MSEFGGLWKPQNNPACTKNVIVFIMLKLDTIRQKKKKKKKRVQELCESRGGRPGLSVLMSLTVSVDVKQHWTMLRHWSQFVPNMSADIPGHEALLHHQEEEEEEARTDILGGGERQKLYTPTLIKLSFVGIGLTDRSGIEKAPRWTKIWSKSFQTKTCLDLCDTFSVYAYHYTVTTRIISASRWAAM